MISLGAPAPGADLVLGTLEPLDGIPSHSVDLITIDQLALNDFDEDRLFSSLYRIVAPGGRIRLGFGAYHLTGRPAPGQIEKPLSDLIMKMMKLGFAIEVLPQPQYDIYAMAYFEDGRRLQRSRKWAFDSESFKSTTLLELKPACLTIDRGDGTALLVKRKDEPGLRAAVSAMTAGDPPLETALRLFDAVANVAHVFDDASCIALVDRYAEHYLATKEGIDTLLVLTQTMMLSSFVTRTGLMRVSALYRAHEPLLAANGRFAYALIKLAVRLGDDPEGDAWATYVYRRFPNHHLIERIFNGHVITTLVQTTGHMPDGHLMAAFEPSADLYLEGVGSIGRFGNQITVFAYCLCAASILGLNARTPRWIGSFLFEGQAGMSLLRRPDAPVCRDTDVKRAVLQGQRADVAGRRVTGFSNLNFEDVRAARPVFEAATKIDPRILAQLLAADQAIIAMPEYLAIHVRRGDFGHGRFKITPEHLFETLSRQDEFAHLPIALISDAKPGELAFSDDFMARVLPRAAYESDVIQMIADWVILTRGTVLFHANSTFSYSAALKSAARAIFRPNPELTALVRYDPWSSIPFVNT